MRYRILPAGLLAGFFVFSPGSFFAQQPTVSIEVLATFDYPGTGNSTTGVSINDAGEIAGFYTDPLGVTRGYVRSRDGTFSAPIVEPDDGTSTFALGINNLGIVSGYFLGAADGADHGYLLSGDVFTQFDVPSAVSTFVEKNNDAGDFVGASDTATQDLQAFANIGGSIMAINIPEAVSSFAQGINRADDVVGYYSDSGGIVHAFIRDAAGVLKFPIDFPGAVFTSVLEAVNDHNGMVGRYSDGAGVIHGAFLRRPNIFVSFDFPGAAATSLNGINNREFVTGRYTDSSGIRHGIVARVRRTPAN